MESRFEGGNEVPESVFITVCKQHPSGGGQTQNVKFDLTIRCGGGRGKILNAVGLRESGSIRIGNTVY